MGQVPAGSILYIASAPGSVPGGEQRPLSRIDGDDHFHQQVQPTSPQVEGSGRRNVPLCGQCCKESSKASKMQAVGQGPGGSLLAGINSPALYKVGLFPVLLSTRWPRFLHKDPRSKMGDLRGGMPTHPLKSLQGSGIPCLSCRGRLPHPLSISGCFRGLWEGA